MNFQLTDAAIDLLNGAVGPITLTEYRLGTDYGYIPSGSDSDIHGSLVFQGTPSAPIAVNANLVKYSVYLDYDVGPFEFGELGLFVHINGQVDPILFALGAGSQSIEKTALSSGTDANSIRADIYLSMVGTNYEMWLDLAESNNKFRIASVNSPDTLPPSPAATPNTYIVDGAGSDQSSFLAYTNRIGIWNFDRYSQSPDHFTIIGATPNSVVVEYTEEIFDLLQSTYKGHKILEFVTGNVFSICRYIKDVVVSNLTLIVSFYTHLAIIPSVGDQFVVQVRDTGLDVDDFIPYSEKNNWSGVATIVDRPTGQPTGPVTEYNYKKIPVSQAARGSLVFLGHWDASTNIGWAEIDGGDVRTYTLFDDGMMIDHSFSSDRVEANGKVFLVSVGGSTELDGYTDWIEGDVIIAFGSQWYRLRKTESSRRYQLSVYQDLVHSQRTLYYQKFTESLQLTEGSHNNAICVEAPNIANVSFFISLNGIQIGRVDFPIGATEGIVLLDNPTTLVNVGDVMTITSPSSVGSISGLSIVLTFNFV